MVDVNFGFRISDTLNNGSDITGPWSSGAAIAAVSDLDTNSADWVRLDVVDVAWRAGKYDVNNDATPAFYGPTTSGLDTAQEASLHGYVRFNHSGGDTPLFFRTIGALGVTTALTLSAAWYSTWINVIVVPPASKKLCPHEIRAKPLGKYFASDLYVWHPDDRCKGDCGYCEVRAKKYGTEEERKQRLKEERQAEKAKERDTLGEVMLYLLERTKKADEKEKCAKEILAPLSEKKGSDSVKDGLLKLPLALQPRALLLMAHCPCSCGRQECDICGCHELKGCETGMCIPRADSADYLELKRFWMTVLSNLNDDKSLCDLAKRQGAYRSIRAFLSSEATQGEKL